MCSQMPGQGPSAYVAERDGNAQNFLDIFVAQRQYIEAYTRVISSFSSDDNNESVHWGTHSAWAGEELTHLYPFRAKLLQGCRLAELTNATVPALEALEQTCSKLEQNMERLEAQVLPSPPSSTLPKWLMSD